MNLLVKTLAVVAICSSALPAAAQEYRAVNTLYVNRVDKYVFEVIGRPSANREDYWCGAGDYVRRVIGAPWKTKIFVVSGISRGVTTGAKSAARFTLHPEEVGIEPYEAGWISDTLTIGYSRSVTFAFDRCHRRPGFYGVGLQMF